MKKIISILILICLCCAGIFIYQYITKEPTKNIEETFNSSKEPNETIANQGIFSSQYESAQKILDMMTLEEKIGQLFLIRVPLNGVEEDIQNYQFGGLLYFARDFENLTKEEVKNKIQYYQSLAKIPMLMAVDEEGGTVSRISSNSNLVAEPFKSPSEIFKTSGLEGIEEDTIKKSDILFELGLNLNLAPVVDIATDPNDYMYSRSLQEDTETTSQYATTVIKASDPSKVSYTLKHFPGYGNNVDTHEGFSVDSRSIETITTQDLQPFQAGIKAGAEAVLVSHNIVTALDENNPASLSPAVHDLLRNEMNFTGIIMTDNLDMAGVTMDEKEKIAKALTSGNDLLITTDYKTDIAIVKQLLDENTITEELIDEKVLKILAWKCYKKMI